MEAARERPNEHERKQLVVPALEGQIVVGVVEVDWPRAADEQRPDEQEREPGGEREQSDEQLVVPEELGQ